MTPPPSLSVLSGKEHYSLSRDRARDHKPCRHGLCNQAAVALKRGTEGAGGVVANRLLCLERLLCRLVWKSGLKNKVARPARSAGL